MKKTFLIMLALLLSVSAIIAVPASDGIVQKSLLYDDVKITLDSREIKPCDVNGNYIEPFIIEGTTYLPVRGIASSLGLAVGWDDNTKTVSLTAPQIAEKSVLYDEDDIKAVYNGFEANENGVVMSFSVNNGSKDDIQFNVTVNSADGKSVGNQKKYIVIRGREVNIRHLVSDVKKANKIKFTFSLQNAETHLDVCANKEFTAIPDGAEPSDQKPKESYQDPEGEITHENFGNFFKAYGEFKNGRYIIESVFTDRHDCYTGSVGVGYSIPAEDMMFEIDVITDVYDPVLKTTSPAPVAMEITHFQGEELYKYKLSSILNGVSWSISGEIKLSDRSVTNKGVAFSDGFDNVDQKYTRLDARKALDDMAEKLVNNVFDIAVKEADSIFEEKSSRLNLEFFGLE